MDKVASDRTDAIETNAGDPDKPGSRIRRSILELQTWYEEGKKKPLEDLIRAFKGIQELETNNPNSFWIIAGYHGQPYRGPGKTDPTYWGGFCHHGNILFPTWHRAYMLRLEDALRSIEGCEEVTLPYWDTTDKYTLNNGIPWVLNIKEFVLDGKVIANPLQSYKFQEAITSEVPDRIRFSKPEGYETVRYPQAGLLGTDEAKKRTEEHNKKYSDHIINIDLLNKNIKGVLNPSSNDKLPQGVLKLYSRCLDAPNYTLFSNDTSQEAWNSKPENQSVVCLENAHNFIHATVGGFFYGGLDDPGDSLRVAMSDEVPEKHHFDPIVGSTADMGENDYTAFDPIFFFHHCNVDRVFSIWQKLNEQQGELVIEPEFKEFPGTNSNDRQGPTPGSKKGECLTLETGLQPFIRKSDGEFVTSQNVANINKLDYRYTDGSFSDKEKKKETEKKVFKLIVSGINRAAFHGSFMLRVFMSDLQGGRRILGAKPFLSRWNVLDCANCQKHLEALAVFDLPSDISSESSTFLVEIDSRDNDHPELRSFDMKTTDLEANIEIKWDKGIRVEPQKPQKKWKDPAQEMAERISELEKSIETHQTRINKLEARIQARGGNGSP